MKIQTIIAIACLLVVSTTQAKRRSETKKQNYTTIKRYSIGDLFNKTKSAARSFCKKNVFKLLTTAENELKDYSEKGYRYECREVKFEIEAEIKRDGNSQW